MRSARLFLPAAISAFWLTGCGEGHGAAAIPTTAAQMSNWQSVVRAGSRLEPYRHTPALPPPQLHRVTAADRARARAGGWQQVVKSPFASPGTELLMTDGTVMVQNSCSGRWASLTPDQNGSYVNGTWSQKASLPSGYAPLYFASAVLADGKLIVNGGEYNFCKAAETSLGAIYDPVANAWTTVAAPSGWTSIGDAQSAVLDDGTYMLGNCCTGVQALFDERSLTWTQTGPGNGKSDPNSEEGWTLLRSGNVLTADVTRPSFAEVYSPTANAWSSAGRLAYLVAGGEIGPQLMRPNNTVFVAGANGHTAIYNGGSGIWSNGPDFPIVGGQQLDVADGPAVLLTNGNVLIPASPGLYKSPTSFFVFNGTKLIGTAAPPNAINDSTYNLRLLLLPTGQVLETDGSSDIEIYTPGVNAQRAIAPSITSVPTTLARGSSYAISGKRFNGFSQANMYGDDDQQATNYPLVRIVNDATGHVFYARTHGFGFMGIGSQRIVSATFDVPASIEPGAGSLVVVANGIPSTPIAVTIN